MTIVVHVSYPFGYVHATPWGTHVNEGAVEWPPSPWRLLRALVATWHTRCPDLTAEDVVPVLDALADAPAVRTAPRTEASIRTYLPAEGFRSGSTKPDVDLAIDSFAAVAPDTGVAYRWTADLKAGERETLARLIDALPYLGRAESVCEATVGFDDAGGEWLEPVDDATGVGTRTLVPTTPLDLEELCVSIRTMRKGGRLHPSGATWVRYAVPRPLISASRPARAVKPQVVRAVRLALRPVAQGSAPVSIRQTIVVAEAMRAAAMSQYGSAHGRGVSEMLAGKDTEGTPLVGNRHAHWLPLDLDGDRLLDTVLVWAPDPGGLGEQEVAALGAIRRLRLHGGDGLGGERSLAVGFEASGELADLDLGGAVGSAARWTTATPFLPQRHRKGEPMDDFLADCVRRELSTRGVDIPFILEPDRRTSWGSFRRYRRAERLRHARPGYGFSLVFEQPVGLSDGGPLCIGSLSHFGMGRFVTRA